MRRIELFLIVVLAATAAPALPAWGGPADTAADISREVMSPFCPGVTLHDCPSAEAAQLRARIESWVRSGMTRDRIMARLESEYGPSVRAAPATEGTDLLAWLVPAAAVGIGAALAYVAARRWSRRHQPETTPGRGAAPSAEERARLEAELATLRGGT